MIRNCWLALRICLPINSAKPKPPRLPLPLSLHLSVSIQPYRSNLVASDFLMTLLKDFSDLHFSFTLSGSATQAQAGAAVN